MHNYSSNSVLTNVTISGNTGNTGGGLLNYNSNPVLRNSIVWGNSGGTISNNVSAPDVQYSLVEGGYPGTGNLNVDPRFATAVPSSPSTSGNLRLQSSSPAINTGSNAALPAGTTTDRDDLPRIVALSRRRGCLRAPGGPGITFAPVAPRPTVTRPSMSPRLSPPACL
jgi:hypothetical protein